MKNKIHHILFVVIFAHAQLIAQDYEDMSKRDHTSISMAINPDDIPEVKKRLTKMRREICKFLERPQKKRPTQVYNLSLSFFSFSTQKLGDLIFSVINYR